MFELILSNPMIQGYAWIVFAIILLIAEIGTPGLFYFLSFAAGSLGAAVATFLGACIYTQCAIAIIVASVFFFILRTYAKPLMKPKQKTNIEALMNKQAVVIETIDPHTAGRIKIKGEEWTAKTDSAHILHKGTTVTIIGLDGNKLIVK